MTDSSAVSKTLLLVDDEPAQLSALQRELHGTPHVILTAGNGREALDLLLHHQVHVIISDYRMPLMNGVEFLTEARKLQRDAVRVILSGYADVEAIIGAINRGHIYKFVNKPWDRAELLDVIADALAYGELLRRSAQFERIFENSAEGVFIVGADGLIEAVNPSFTIITSYVAADVIGSPHEILRAEALSEKEAKTMADMIQHAGHWFGEVLCRRSNGEVFPAEIKLSGIRDAGGRLAQIVGMCADITERKQTEAELERHRHHLEAIVEERTAALMIAKDAAEAANRATSIFLANISHELRTPMNGILGMTQLAQRRATDPKLLEQLGKAIESAQRLLTLINNLIDISQIEAKRLDLDCVAFDLDGIRGNLLGLIGPKAAAKGLGLEIDFAPELSGRRFEGDPVRLAQVISNLAANAVKFTDHGSVSIRASLFGEDAEGALLSFEVEDTGIGISAEDQRRLFTLFEQADGSSTRRHGGLGLGLALCRQLVELMGGSIGVSSRPDQGSTFWFTVTLKPVAGTEAA